MPLPPVVIGESLQDFEITEKLSLDLASARPWAKHDAVNQAPKRGGRGIAIFGAIQRLGYPSTAAANMRSGT